MTPTGHALRDQVAVRAQALEDLFGDIARTRMAGLPVMHPGLRVEAVGFLHDPAGDPAGAPGAPALPGATGILVTPWFMNLVWMPLRRSDAPARIGASRLRRVGSEQFAFTGAHEERFGAFEACSLFSPMFEFRTQAEATATAAALLSQLRAQAPGQAERERPLVAARRSFLFGADDRRAARERAR
jgi:[NiFe] hydrogenase assembly HybE family chaperone